MSEWLKECGCKPHGSAYAGSNPAPPIPQENARSIERFSDRARLLACMGSSSPARSRDDCCGQAIAKADAVTGNAVRLVRGALAVPMQGAGATADTDPPCPKARARLDRRRARVSTPERRVSRLTPRHCDTSPGGSYGTPGADTAATRRHIEAECPQRVCFRTQQSLGAVVNRPSVWSDR